MVSLKEFPEIMRGAKEDLSANVAGRFSPDDWERILRMARERFTERRRGSPAPEIEDWHAVVLEFYRERYWGFTPDYRPPAAPKRKMNLGVRFAIMTFVTFTVALMSLAWAGQNYTTSGKAGDLALLLIVIALVLLNFGYFLWQHRNHED